MRILFFGTPHAAALHLEAALKTNHEITGVVTRPDKPRGRGMQVSESPVKETAGRLGIQKIFQPTSLQDSLLIQEWRELKPDLFITVAYGKILPPDVLTIPKFGSINVHFSLLPELRGPAPVEFAILQGKTETGVTIFWLDKEMDTGPILLQRAAKISSRETATSLMEKLSALGQGLVAEGLTAIEKNAAARILQDPSRATYTKFIAKSEGVINWSEPAQTIDRKIRAMAGRSSGITSLAGKQLQILEAAPESAGGSSAIAGLSFGGPDAQEGSAHAGQITRLVRGSGFIVKCGLGELLVTQVKPGGGRAMDAWSFLQGRQYKNEAIILGR